VSVSSRWQDQWGRGASDIGPFKVDWWVWRKRYKGACVVAARLLCVFCLSRFSFSVCRRGFQASLLYP
jgi:hypothetical protein